MIRMDPGRRDPADRSPNAHAMSPESSAAPSRSYAPDPRSAVTIRSLRSREEFEVCAELQRVIWGRDFVEVVPPAMLQVEKKIGGIVAAAFDAAGDAVGFVFGMSGFRDGRPVHWSHMLGVRPGHRGRGLGQRLKAFQRERLLEAGITEAFWTFDPLEARNAHLNLNRLGARIVRYVVNMYGTETGSTLHRGLGTDRFVVRWPLDAPRTRRAIGGGRLEEVIPVEAREARVINRPGSAHDPPLETLPDPALPRAGSPLRVEVPPRIQSLRDERPDTAVSWRRSTRAAFLAAADAGYAVTGFRRGADGRACYVLTPAAEGSSRLETRT